MRVHKSYILNFEQVVAYNKSDGGSLELNTGVHIPVSPDRAQQILEQIQIVKR